MLLLLGFVIGVLGAIVQGQRITVGGTLIPTGTILALAVLVPIARAAAWWLNSRLGALYLGIGWLIATLAMSTAKPWGDLILDAGTRQIAYLVGGSFLLASAAAYPLLDPDRARTRPSAGEPGVTDA